MTRGRRLALVALALASVALAAWAVWSVSLASRRASDSPTGDPVAGPHPAGSPGLAASPDTASRVAPTSARAEPAAALDAPGRVVAEDGGPIGDAVVVGLTSWEDMPAGLFAEDAPRTRTDAQGRFRLRAAGKSAAMCAVALGFLATTVDREPSGADTVIVLHRDSGRILGTVRDETGKPVAGARLVTGLESNGWDREWRGPGGYTTTASDGTYSLPRGGEQVAAWGDAWALQVKRAPDGESREPSTLDFVLRPGARVRGRVVDAESDQGVPGASVAARRRRQYVKGSGEPYYSSRVERWHSAVPTGEDGTFEILVSPEFEDLQVTARAYSPSWAPGRLHANGSVPLVIRLDRFVEYSGIVLDEFGAPFEGAEVRIAGGATTTSGPHGEFRIAGRDSGGVGVVASAGEKTPGVAATNAESREGILLQMAAAAPLQGQVLGADGVARPDVRLQIDRVRPVFGYARESWEGIPLAGPDARPLAVDAGGRFRIAGLIEGQYRIRVLPTPTASPAMELEVEVYAGSQREDLRIVAEAGGAWQGVVVDEHGVPIADAEIDLPQKMIGGGVVGRTWTRTDANGRFALQGIPDRPARCEVARDGYEEWTGVVDPHDGEARIVLRQGCLVRLCLSLEGVEPPDDTELTLRASFPGRRRSDRVGKAWVHQRTVRWETVGPPGEWDVGVAGAGWEGQRIRLDVPRHGGEFHSVLALRRTRAARDLASSEPALEPTTGAFSIAGRVLNATGVPARWIGVWAHASASTAGGPWQDVTDGDGRFVIRGLESGAYRLEFGGNPRSGMETADAATIEDVVAGTEGLLVRLAPPAHIRGRARAAPGVDLTDLEVRASRWARPFGSGATESDGRFSILDVPAGTYRLTARCGPLVAWSGSPITADSGEVVRGVVLDLVPGGVVEGTLVGDDGKPVAGAEIVACAGFAPAPPNVKADASGRFRFDGLAPGRWKLMVMLDEATGQDLDPVLVSEPGKTVRVTFAEAR